jgi:hypothetical protein
MLAAFGMVWVGVECGIESMTLRRVAADVSPDQPGEVDAPQAQREAFGATLS